MNDPVPTALVSVSSQDCLLGMALPTTDVQYQEHRRQNQHRDYIPNLAGAWPKYVYDFLLHYRRAKVGIERNGGRIVEQLTFDKFPSLFSSARIVILFAHWREKSGFAGEGEVEFYDGLVPVNSVANAIPEDFSGVLDLCVCHPVNLVWRVCQWRSQCLVKFSERKVQPRYWIYFYEVLFRILLETEMSYAQALELAAAAFMFKPGIR